MTYAANPDPERPVPWSTTVFCGCGSCIVREVLISAWDELLGGAVQVIENNMVDHTAVNELYKSALFRIANDMAHDPALTAQLALGEASADDDDE